MRHRGKARRLPAGTEQGLGWALVMRHPKVKLPDQLREVMRLKQYLIRTER